jgi:hypothetical protein
MPRSPASPDGVRWWVVILSGPGIPVGLDGGEPLVDAAILVVQGKFPSGRTDDGHEVTWAHLPARGIRLASPAVLLHLLAAAVAAFRHGSHMLTLPGDVLAIPALGPIGVDLFGCGGATKFP